MANEVLAGLGEINTNFLLNDFAVYVQNTSATGSYVSTDWALLGYTSAEKSMNPINEKYEREDKIPRIITYTKTIRMGLEMSFDLSNMNDDVEKILLNATETSLGATGTELGVGTSLASTQYRAVRFAGERDDGVTWVLTIPKAELKQNGERTLGGESETLLPIMCKAVYNPLGTATKNLFTIEYLASGINATATVPEGFA